VRFFRDFMDGGCRGGIVLGGETGEVLSQFHVYLTDNMLFINMPDF
jgi:hypothetical protein